MKRFCILLTSIVAVLLARTLRAGDVRETANLSPLQLVALQNNQTIKTMDTFAGQVMSQITGESKLDGLPALYTLLDMSFRPDQYVDRKIIKIKNVPLREEFRLLKFIDEAEKNRIVHDGTISLTFMERPEVQMLLQNAEAASVNKTKAVGELDGAASALRQICQDEKGFIPAAIFIPPVGSSDLIWHAPMELANEPIAPFAPNAPKLSDEYRDQSAILVQFFHAQLGLKDAWVAGDVAKINSNINEIAQLLPTINPKAYPSLAKRKTEVIYNRLMMLTIPGAAFYFFAMVLFLMSSRAGYVPLRLWGLRLMFVGFLIHTTGIAIRWWLVGDIFPPIKNEFESVMFSAWFGVLLGMIMEIRKSRGIFGAAASFVGTFALVAIFGAPYVVGRDIGGQIGQVQGILMSYWLYIHVTMVTASYSMIGMAFMLSVWWLVRYYMDYGTLRRMPPTLISSDGIRGFDVVRPTGSTKTEKDIPMPASGGAIAMTFAQTLGMMLFMPVARPAAAVIRTKTPPPLPGAESTNFLAMLDQCNLVVLQLAFWVLGAGIVCGAIWADQSWGRPWGWDPKETFALVTWIVYLIVVHVRVATVDKAWWTAVLSVIGFFVMLFNWIGVNFMLVGLHSYA